MSAKAWARILTGMNSSPAFASFWLTQIQKFFGV